MCTNNSMCILEISLNMWIWEISFFIITFAFHFSASNDKPCIPKEYGARNIVCVCNMTHCDTIQRIPHLAQGEFVKYTTTRDGLRFNKTLGIFKDKFNGKGTNFVVNLTKTFQKIMGFGGAFTDSAGINIDSLSLETKEKLLRSYFSTDGIEYNFGRVPVAGCDFSTHEYTYDDNPGDTNLTLFNLTMEDYYFKIPLIKEAQQLSERGVHLVGAAWSAPPWMKTNNAYSGYGFLKEEFYEAWAQYLVKFLSEYEKLGIQFWGMSTGNEPVNGLLPVNWFNSMGWTPSSQGLWIKKHFGPALKNFHSEMKLLVIDDQRFMLPWWMNSLMADKEVASFIDGVAVHWYWDFMFPASLLDRTHHNFPDKFILATEACVGDKPWNFDKVKLGSWSRGELYMEDILEDLNHWATGWIDWNLALNPQGGPNWAKNYVDSPIIVNSTANEFYKQPMFYALGHFSKFLPEGSVRVEMKANKEGIRSAAFLTTEEMVVIILYNRWNSNIQVTITDSSIRYITAMLPKRSFTTVIYRRDNSTLS